MLFAAAGMLHAVRLVAAVGQPALRRYNENKFFTPILFTAYVVFMAFILLNMFLAIVNDSFAALKQAKAALRAARQAPSATTPLEYSH